MSLQPSIYRIPGSEWKHPFPKGLEVIYTIIKPPYRRGEKRKINLCCGWGFGKTTLGIDIAQVLLQLGMDGFFLEPNANLMQTLFLPRWMEMIPPDMYKFIKRGNEGGLIEWKSNRARLHYGHRAFTASPSQVAGKLQGHTIGFYIDDEASTGCKKEVHQQINGRMRQGKRRDGSGIPFRARITLSTPRMGPYAEMLDEQGSITIRGRSEDNIYLDEEIWKEMRAGLTRAQARRDMDGELMALEDQLWCMADLENSWPVGSIDDQHPRFDPAYPWYLFSDLGSATGADLVVQKIDRGFNYSEPRWVVVADLCPQYDASIRSRYRKLASMFQTPPTCIVAGRDANTRNPVDGATPAYFARKIWGNVRIHPADEHNMSKQVQLDLAQWMLQDGQGHRRVTIARDLYERKPHAALDQDSRRGFLEMLQQDIWLPEEDRREADFLPKGSKIRVQHIRDAFLMGIYNVAKPPTWRGDPTEKEWESAA